MRKKTLVICTIVLMGMTSMVGCNRTTDNQVTYNQMDTIAAIDSIVAENVADNTTSVDVRGLVQKNNLKIKVDNYNYMDCEYDISFVYNNTKYYIPREFITSEAYNAIEDIFSSAGAEQVNELKYTDIKPETKLSDLTVQK